MSYGLRVSSDIQPGGTTMSTRPMTRWVLLLTSVASLMVGLDILVVTTALSTIRTDLGATVGQLEWTVTAYNLSFAVLLMTAAALGDRFGRRRMFIAGLSVFTVASAGCALAPGAGWLIVARAVQGVGAALVMPLSFALISAGVPPEQRARALGISGGVTGLATLAGPLLGGAVTELFSWQWIFWINVPIGVAAVILVQLHVQESHGPDTSLDVGGVVLVTLASLGLVWGLVRAGAVGWSSAEVLVAIVAGVTFAAGFVRHEASTPAPLIPLRLLRSRAFAIGNVATFLHASTILGAVFWMAQFLQTSLGYGPFGAGIRLLPWTGTLMIVAPAAGALANRLGERAIMITGLSMAAVGLGWLALVAEPGVSYADVVAPLVVSGIGNSMVFPAVANAVVSAVSPAAIGKATGVNSMLREFGGVFGIAVLAAVFGAAGGYSSAGTFTHGFVAVIAVCAGISLLNAAVSALLPAHRTADTVSDRGQMVHRVLDNDRTPAG
jgi:EmrB/QacA subfamily drug resistance transporter